MLDALIQRNEHIAGRRKHPTIASTTRSLRRDRLLVLVTQHVVELNEIYLRASDGHRRGAVPAKPATDQFAGRRTQSLQ